MGGDCKSPGSAFEGSNPSPATSVIAPSLLRSSHKCLCIFGELILKNLASIFRNKTRLLLIVFALIVGGIGAQTISLLDNSSVDSLPCINSTTKVITNPGTSRCPKGSERLDPGAQGADGASGGKITELSICGSSGTSLCKIGSKGPGGGLIFFVDYNDQSPDFNYLEAAPTDGVFASSATTGVWATTLEKCGALSNANCQLNSIYTQTGVALATVNGLHSGLFGGQAATDAIVAKHSGVAKNSYAAGVADDYSTATKSDYYLPTKDEIMIMQKNLNEEGLGVFAGNLYWSSSESDATIAWSHFFNGGFLTSNYKDFSGFVRPVRAF